MKLSGLRKTANLKRLEDNQEKKTKPKNYQAPEPFHFILLKDTTIFLWFGKIQF